MGWVGRDGKSIGSENRKVGIMEWWNDEPNIPFFQYSSIPMFC